MKKAHFTEPQLCTCGDNLQKKWFVHFDVTHPTTGEIRRIQLRGEINKFHTTRQRHKEGAALIQICKEQLRAGHTFFPEEKKSGVEEIVSSMGFNKALEFALSKCELSKSTQKGYRSSVKFFKEAAERLQVNDWPVERIEKKHIKLLLDDIKKTRGWSNKAYNKHKGWISAVLERLEEYEIIHKNPARKIKELRTTETRKFIPFTEDEKDVIREYFFLHHYRYFCLLMFIYHPGMRPKEVLALKIKDINLGKSLITIYPQLESENSKTTSIRYIAINPFLASFIREMKLDDYPKEFYVFASPFPSGQGNRGSAPGGLKGAMHPDYFKPGTTQIKRDTITKFWNKIVIKKLGINKHQYAMKHTGADDKILAGIDLDALKELYGHSSKFMTEKYAQAVKQVYRKQIIEKSPSF